MEHTVAKYRSSTISQLDYRNSLGDILDTDKKFKPGRLANVDTMDITPPARGSVNEPVLESINAACIHMHADIGHLEDIFDVTFISSLVH